MPIYPIFLIKETLKMIQLSTPEQHYWNRTGMHQGQFEELSESIPLEGQGLTLHAELIRCVSNLMYEYMNNGNLNARGEQWSPSYFEDDTGLFNEGVLEEVFVKDWFLRQLNFIVETIDTPAIQAAGEHLRQIILQDRAEYTPEEMNKYDILVDWVLHYISTTLDVMLEPQN